MKKIRYGALSVFCALFSLTACQGQLGQGPPLVLEGKVTEENKTLPAETEADKREPENMSDKQWYVYVPDRFVVYNDGQAHRLLYAADKEYYHYSTFTSISLEEYGFQNISIPSSLAVPQEEVYVIPEGTEFSDLDLSEIPRETVIDDSAIFSSDTRQIYSRRTPGMYMFHAWVQEYDGDIHTLSLKDFADILRIGGSITSDFEDLEKLEDGSTRYTCFYKDDREYTGDGVPYYGKAVVRLKDGKAWCSVFLEKDHADGPRMADYVLKQSVTYAEEGAND